MDEARERTRGEGSASALRKERDRVILTSLNLEFGVGDHSDKLAQDCSVSDRPSQIDHW